MTLLDMIAVGSYLFTVGAYTFAAWISRRLASLEIQLATLTVKVENHMAHELKEIQDRLDSLERE